MIESGRLKATPPTRSTGVSSPRRHPLQTRPDSTGPADGFTLIELVVAAAVLTIAMGATIMSLISSMSLNNTNRESTLAANAARSAVETLAGRTFREVFALYNTDPDDDPGGAGTAPGKYFAVPGLNVRHGDPDGFVGEIIFPGDGATLRENVADDVLGLPRDLNGDQAVDAENHASDYILLPVRVRISWTGVNGNREFELTTSLLE